MPTTEDRFWAKVYKTDHCWIWTASKRNKGYGAFCYRADGRLIQGRAHRYSYEINIGKIPYGLFVLHRCDNPACVRPSHLFVGTNDDNINDMIAKGRHVPGGTHCANGGNWERGESHHAAKLSTTDVTEIRRIYALGGTSYSKLGGIFGINGSAAFKIVKGLLWKHVN